MKEIEYFNWYLPNRNPRGKPYLSRWKMNAEEAASRGAVRPEPTSREVHLVGETEAERLQQRLLTDTSHDAWRRAGRDPSELDHKE